jgi:hypothetical protein
MQAVMAERSKFVPIALAITLFVSRAAALYACGIPMPAMQEMAMGDAAMTVNVQPVSIQQGNVPASCCQLSAANAPPVSVPRVQEYGATDLATTSSTSILEVPSAAVRAKPAKTQPRRSGSSLQSTLCIFLI